MEESGLLYLIPVGKENAVPARLVWEAQGRLWTVARIENRLNDLVKSGQIERTYVSSATRSVKSVYFRKSDG